jgi:hypothetical protein
MCVVNFMLLNAASTDNTNAVERSTMKAARTSLCRLHLTSSIFAMIAASLLVHANVVVPENCDSLDPAINNEMQLATNGQQFGWPIVACYTYTRSDTRCVGKINFVLIGLDATFNVFILALVILSIEWVERRRPWVARFRIH